MDSVTAGKSVGRKEIAMSAHLMKLKAHELDVDFRVQREEEPAQCRKLARDWNDMYVGNLTASYRDGEFFLIDGQQRYVTKLRYLDEPDYEFDVMVHDDLTVEDEGRMFLAMNRDHKAVSAYDKYKVAVAVGEPDETAVEAVVTSLGMTVGKSSGETCLGIAATLVRIQKAYGSDVLRDALIINERLSYPWGDNPWDAVFIEGVAMFLNRHQADSKFRIDRLVTALRRSRKASDVTKLVQVARGRAVNNNRAVGAMAQVLFEEYNSGLREANRITMHV
jgi:hypothetical protein